MYATYPTIAEYEYVEIDDKTIIFKVMKHDGSVEDIEVDISGPRAQFALGGTFKELDLDVIGNLLSALEAK